MTLFPSARRSSTGMIVVNEVGSSGSFAGSTARTTTSGTRRVTTGGAGADSSAAAGAAASATSTAASPARVPRRSLVSLRCLATSASPALLPSAG